MRAKLCSRGNFVVTWGQGQVEARIVERRQRRLAAPQLRSVSVTKTRADARYCSKACRERARWHAKRQKNDAASLETVPPENETEKRTSGLPNASCRHAGMLSEKRRFPPLPAQRGPSMRFDGGNSGAATIRTIRIASGRTIMP